MGEVTSRAENAQRLLFGAVLQRPGLLKELVLENDLRAEWFTGAHRDLIAAAIRIVEAERSIDAFAVAEEAGRVDVEYVRSLADRPPRHQDPLEYVAVVRDEARWRQRDDRALALGMAIGARDEEAYERAHLAEVEEREDGEDTVLSAEDFASEMMRFLTSGKAADQIPLPYRALTDAANGGLAPGDTTVLSGYSSHGKSILGVEVLEHAVKQGASGCLYTNELTKWEVGMRLVAGMTGVSLTALRSGSLSLSQEAMVVGALAKMPFPIGEVFGWKVTDVTREMRRRRWDVIVLDLFNRLPGRRSTHDVDEIVTLLCDAAAQTGTHLVLVSQLAKPPSKEKIPPPPTGDMLRESNALFTHPANVLFVYRRSREMEDGRVVRQPEGILYWDKVRNGNPEGRVDVYLDERRMRFAVNTLEER